MKLREVPLVEELARSVESVEAVRRFGHIPEALPYGEAVRFASRHASDLESIPFYSLCRGYYLPMMALPPETERRLFGTSTPAMTFEERLQVLATFLDKPVGLTLEEKVALATGELYEGRPPVVSEEVLLQILAQETLQPLSEMRKELVQAGGMPFLWAARQKREKADPPLPARVVALCLTRLKGVRGRERRAILTDLLGQVGRLEAYVIVGLLLDKLHLGFAGRQERLMELLATRWQVPLESVSTACGLRDLGQVCKLVETEGVEALQKIVLQPLTPFRPALSGAVVDQLTYPVWVECKYDGIRLVLHKNTDSSGRMQVAAYTRRRHDWSELLAGLRPLLQALPCPSAILDGELHGYLLSASGAPRPATVYEVHQMLRGEVPAEGMVQLRYIAFDVLYLQGHDLTREPFAQRRTRLEQLLAWPAQMQLPLPIQLSQGGRADTSEQLQRYYEQFRRQGHEGLMVKKSDSTYPIAQRSLHWLKKKPEESLDLILTAAYWGESSSPGQRVFDSYSIACRASTGGLREVGTVAGVDVKTTAQIAQEIMRFQLLTGQSVERRGHNRVAYGVRLNPHIVAAIRYEAVLRDPETGELSLRGPRIIQLRSGEMPVQEAASERELETLALKHRLQ